MTASLPPCLRLGALIAVLALLSACATPVGVSKGDTQSMYHTLTRSVLSAGEPSALTEQTLRRLGLTERFEDDPEGTLRVLRGTGADLSRDRLFALAELSFLYAERESKQEHYLAAAVYAYAFLFESPWTSETALDPRSRLAADLYNLGLGHGLAVPAPAEPEAVAPAAEVADVRLDDRTLALPFGTLALRGDPASFLWGSFRLSRFIPVSQYKVRGLRNRYRQPGVGLPLAGEVTPIGAGPQAEAAHRRVPARVKVPLTAFVRIENARQGIADGRLQGRLELYASDEFTTVEVNGQAIPLEVEMSVTLALGLEGAPVWETELGSFLAARSQSTTDNLVMLHPYRPGRIPVVLVHGTASSSARWAELFNEIWNDPVLRNRVQFWFFTYSTSNPILLSASELRRSLQDIVKELDPEGRDPALRRMVLIGHSQGGLLTRLMVTDSGDRFWNAASRVPFSEIRTDPENRGLIQSAMFFEPVPTITRVVFVATPHRGSFRVSTFVLNAVRRLVTLPVTVVKGVNDLVQQNPNFLRGTFAGVPTAVDNMRPGQPFIRTLSVSPIAPGVTVHSIIAVLGEGPVSGKTDGVVAYESAHLDGVASEKVVRSGHSTQGDPETILEVRRILREHVDGR
jgi:pimeloyl-ACP methyl ester carboxylesterase